MSDHKLGKAFVEVSTADCLEHQYKIICSLRAENERLRAACEAATTLFTQWPRNDCEWPGFRQRSQKVFEQLGAALATPATEATP
jgi:hypothetical protein